ncbi:MAG: phage tail tube protein [Alphaproteobacteria bacterium]|nr:phage tail tube protein [Alphaproteobacteria bacterium]
MSDVQTASGWKIYIGAEDADNSVDTQAEYEAESWTQIGKVEDLGEFGDQWETTTFNSLEDARRNKLKTVKDGGDLNLVVGFVPGDSGQVALATAEDSYNNYPFKITANDASSGSPSSPTTFYFRARVTSNRIAAGAVDNVVRRNVTLAINSDQIQVAAV